MCRVQRSRDRGEHVICLRCCRFCVGGSRRGRGGAPASRHPARTAPRNIHVVAASLGISMSSHANSHDLYQKTHDYTKSTNSPPTNATSASAPTTRLVPARPQPTAIVLPTNDFSTRIAAAPCAPTGPSAPRGKPKSSTSRGSGARRKSSSTRRRLEAGKTSMRRRPSARSRASVLHRVVESQSMSASARTAAPGTPKLATSAGSSGPGNGRAAAI